MPMVRGADDDGVQILLFQQFSVLFELLRLRSDFLRGEIEVWLVKVANCGNLGIGMFKKSIENLIAAVAQADESQAYPLVGAQNAKAAQSCAGAGDSDGF